MAVVVLVPQRLDLRSARYSSKGIMRSMTPPGQISMMRLAMELTNSWSWLVNKSDARKFHEPVVERGDGLEVQVVRRFVEDEAVGASESMIRDSRHRTFSPPDSTRTGFRASSPEKSMRPRKERI